MRYRKKEIDRGIYVDASDLAETIERYHQLGYGVDVECRYKVSSFTGGASHRYNLTIVKPVKEESACDTK